MFCTNCGKQISDDAVFCGSCGMRQPLREAQPVAPVSQPIPAEPIPAPEAVQAEPPVTQEPAVQEPVIEEPAAQEPVMEEPVSQEPWVPSMELPVQEPVRQPDAFVLNTTAQAPVKKKKKFGAGKIVLIAVALVLVVGIVLAAVNWAGIVRFFKRTFGDPTEYLQTAEKAVVATDAKSLATLYGNYLDAYASGSSAAKGQIKLAVSEPVRKLAEEFLSDQGIELDLSWVESLVLEPAFQSCPEGVQLDVGVGANGVVLATVSTVVDLDKQTVSLGIPELSDTYMEMDLTEYVDEETLLMLDTLAQQQDLTQELIADLPSEKEVEALINNLGGVVVDHYQDAEKSDETVKQDGVEQKLFVLHVELSEKEIGKLIVALLEALSEDETVEKFLNSGSRYMNGMAALYGETEEIDLYPMFQDGMEELIAQMEDVDLSSKTMVELDTYLDSQDAIVGRAVTVNIDGTKEKGHYLTVTNGEEFSFEAEVMTLQITGKGTTGKDGKTNAEYRLTAMGQELAVLEVKDSLTGDNGKTSGTYRLRLEDDLVEAMGFTDMISEAVSSGVLELTIKGDTATLALQAAGVEMFALDLTGEAMEAGDVSAPTDSFNIEDTASMLDWIADWDLETVTDGLEEVGLPQEYKDVVDDILEVYAEQFG